MVLVSQTSPPHEKIALFRSLFRGRDDVYPRRFESRRTGKAGYQPACANEWVRGLCEKPRIKCSDCHQRCLLPVTDDVSSWHLKGKDAAGQPFVAGVYPLLLDETCHLLAIDFDKAGWQEDVLAFLATCLRFGLPAALDRTRSGQGGYVWIFFDEAIPAALARRLASFLLTETMEERPDIALDSYDRLFPNQDTMPQGGVGNLIALPLQKRAHDRGDSVFLDDLLSPFIQSLVRKGVVDDRLAEYGHLVVDECHYLSAQTFENVARQSKARFVLGLSATVTRKDGHHPIIFMQCGPVRHRVDPRRQAAARPFEHIVLVQPTSFVPLRDPEPDRRLEFQSLYRGLVEDDQRNRRICADVLEAVNTGRSPLVLTERNEHLDRLEAGMVGHVAT